MKAGRRRVYPIWSPGMIRSLTPWVVLALTVSLVVGDDQAPAGAEESSPATEGSVAGENESPRELLDEAGVSLRDANISSSIVDECFPIDGFDLQYTGSIVHPVQEGIDNTGNGVWTLRYTIPNDHSYEVRFDILSQRRSVEDVEIHVALTRVVYLHIRSCWRDDTGWVQPESFDERGISVDELFRQCDEEAVRYWQWQERLATGLRISN